MSLKDGLDELIENNKQARKTLKTLEDLFALHLKLGSSSSDHATEEHIKTMKEIIETTERTITLIGITLDYE